SIGIEDFRNVDDLELHNCTVREGHMFASHLGGSIWPVRMENCAFDNVNFTQIAGDTGDTDPTMAHYDYNAFATGQPRLPLAGAHDVIVTNFNWQTSWLGNFYLPPSSALINAGSITADQVGLYHFTTQTSQLKETNSIVDIGYHYVATDAYGYPIDTDGDGIPDYLEDSNGNGIFDAGDLGDWLISRFNGLSRTNGLQVFTPLK
ncbi:MAG: hypothetical protein P4L50_10470, partial [Anaerolineaceae bacterium]|nr:hypothetical protein [Anaerolineaceae bacterium]